MMKKLTSGLLCLSLWVGISAQDLCSIDQEEIDTYLYTQDNFGQSFLSCASGQLYRMELPIHNLQTGEADMILKLYQGDGYEGNLIYEETLAMNDEWGSMHYHYLTDPILVEEGSIYTLRLDFNGTYGTMWADFSNAYSSGLGYWNGEAQSGIDMGFNIFIQPNTHSCIEWFGGTSSYWQDPSNWTPAQVPDSNSCVIITSGNVHNPVISEKADVKVLEIAEGGELNLSNDAELNIYQDLIMNGQANLEGTVVMKNGQGNGEIIGSPIFKNLIVEGPLTVTESITILDLLDVENGYLANVDSEIRLLVGAGNHGHVYIPTNNIAGSLTYIKNLSGIDSQPVGIPFNNMNSSKLLAENDGAEIKNLSESMVLTESQGIWSNDPANEKDLDLGDAVLFQSGSDFVRLSGQTMNQPVHIPANVTSVDENDLRALGNPYPSVVRLDGVERSAGVPSVMYRWNPIARQYSAQVAGAEIHPMEDILMPLDVVFFHIPQGESVDLDYSEMAIEPYNLYSEVESDPLQDYHIRLQIESASGRDETIIRFKDEAKWTWDKAWDGLKIASTDALMPGFGSLSEEGRILSINTLPMEVQNEQVFLYLEPGIEGDVLISSLMIDGGPCFSTLHLEDRKTGFFHDLMQNGNYQTEVLFDDDRDRFVLHFDRQEVADNNTLPIHVFEDPLGTPAYDVHILANQLNIRDNELVDLPSGVANVILYSMNGSMVLKQAVHIDQTYHSIPLHLNTGIYYLEVRKAGHVFKEKVWIE